MHVLVIGKKIKQIINRNEKQLINSIGEALNKEYILYKAKEPNNTPGKFSFLKFIYYEPKQDVKTGEEIVKDAISKCKSSGGPTLDIIFAFVDIYEGEGSINAEIGKVLTEYGIQVFFNGDPGTVVKDQNTGVNFDCNLYSEPMQIIKNIMSGSDYLNKGFETFKANAEMTELEENYGWLHTYLRKKFSYRFNYQCELFQSMVGKALTGIVG